MGFEERSTPNEKPIIKNGRITMPGLPGIEWSYSSSEKLGPEWKLHVVPIAETFQDSQWEQIEPIPVFHRTEIPTDRSAPVEHLIYDAELGAPSAVFDDTIEKAEEKMRNHLPFHIEVVSGSIHEIEAYGVIIRTFEPSDMMRRKAAEISQYFRLKNEESHED